jgi:hypothetical protein
MWRFFSSWSGRLDSNQRPLAPHANALPGCATSRIPRYGGVQIYNKKCWAENEFIAKPYLRIIPYR